MPYALCPMTIPRRPPLERDDTSILKNCSVPRAPNAECRRRRPNTSFTRYPASSIQYPVSNTQYPIPSTQYPLPSAQYPIPGSLLPAIKLLNPGPVRFAIFQQGQLGNKFDILGFFVGGNPTADKFSQFLRR